MAKFWDMYSRYLKIVTVITVVFVMTHSSNAVLYSSQNYRPQNYLQQYQQKPKPDEFKYHDKRVVDAKGKYTLEWNADHTSRTLTFTLTVQTSGWVGIGFSLKGEMKEADIVVAGVGPNNKPYLTDLHTDDKRTVFTDSQQNWKILEATEFNGITMLKISRPFDTCDTSDFPITMDLLSVLWAYGETDQYDYHFDKRGSFRVYLLDPVFTAPETDIEMWRFSMEFTLPPKETSYWCKIVKGPQLPTKRHIVRTGVHLPNKLAVDHTHHLLLWRCVAPPGQAPGDVFEEYLEHPGEECIFTEEHELPFLLCRMLVAGWSIGGKDINIPISTGIPIGETFHEYYLLEIHFNNPEKTDLLTVEAGLNTYHTGHLREHDGTRILMPAHDNFGLFMVPPVSPSFEIYGYCSTDCTKTMIPEEGVEILTVLLHSHNSGRKMTLHHFRGDYELPHIVNDGNYDNTFQQQRILREPRLLLPGDLLVMHCTYDNTWTDMTTVAGFSTREEMCSGSVYINKRIPYSACNSQVPQETLLPLINLERVSWNVMQELRIITEPASQAGKFLAEVTDSEVDWTKDLRHRIQETMLKSEQIGSCPQILIPSSTNASLTAIHESLEKLKGTLISATADATNILGMATKYGVTTLIGDVSEVPTRTPGPISKAIYPFNVKPYVEPRMCTKLAAAAAVPTTPYHTGGINTQRYM